MNNARIQSLNGRTSRVLAILAIGFGLSLGFALAAPAVAQTISIVASPHDLSASSGGAVRASVEDQICIFCHTPHNASPVGALWNRALSPQTYQVYSSRALDANPGQPTGSSKLCLSCHDGTIAVGLVLSSDTPIQMFGGITTMPAGRTNLGTDLRDDHPISFVYDSTLANADGHLRSPNSLPSAIKLDANRELQCTSCHDAHNNAFGNFLVMRNTSSELCISCHTVGTTNITAHSDCASCHQSHSAPSGPYLLKQATASRTCLECHDGSMPNAANIQADVNRAYTHDNDAPVDPDLEPHEVMVCTSCHDPHTMQRGVGATPPQTNGPRTTAISRLGFVNGMTLSGTPITPAKDEHEACLRCHGVDNPVRPTIPRQAIQTNMANQFGGSAISYHPVGAPGRSSYVPSLKTGWTTADTMECSDCHSSSTGDTAGAHGSDHAGLLVARYSTQDYTSESESAYALCYRCHDRSSLLADESFPHKRHVVDQQTACSVCHDSHGIASSGGNFTGNARLINFRTDVVFPSPVSGRREFQSTGVFQGTCFLECHNAVHEGTSYP